MYAKTIAVVVCFILSACSAHTGNTRIRIPGADITVDNQSTQKRNGRFCPPGQAKKGRC